MQVTWYICKYMDTNCTPSINSIVYSLIVINEYVAGIQPNPRNRNMAKIAKGSKLISNVYFCGNICMYVCEYI